jgi:hypothetical protein
VSHRRGWLNVWLNRVRKCAAVRNNSNTAANESALPSFANVTRTTLLVGSGGRQVVVVLGGTGCVDAGGDNQTTIGRRNSRSQYQVRGPNRWGRPR